MSTATATTMALLLLFLLVIRFCLVFVVLALEELHLFVKGVPLVLDTRVPLTATLVIRTTQERLGHHGPFLVEDLSTDVEDPVFLDGPGGLDNERTQLVVPPLSDLFPTSTLHVLCESVPVRWAILGNHLDKFDILILSPNSFHFSDLIICV